jgi:hypothetical protein
MATVAMIISEENLHAPAEFEHATVRRIVPEIKGSSFCFFYTLEITGICTVNCMVRVRKWRILVLLHDITKHFRLGVHRV